MIIKQSELAYIEKHDRKYYIWVRTSPLQDFWLEDETEDEEEALYYFKVASNPII